MVNKKLELLAAYGTISLKREELGRQMQALERQGNEVKSELYMLEKSEKVEKPVEDENGVIGIMKNVQSHVDRKTEERQVNNPKQRPVLLLCKKCANKPDLSRPWEVCKWDKDLKYNETKESYECDRFVGENDS